MKYVLNPAIFGDSAPHPDGNYGDLGYPGMYANLKFTIEYSYFCPRRNLELVKVIFEGTKNGPIFLKKDCVPVT